ncbi:MAG TPA: LuxR C-terminal-related transcriptional regulator [Paenibacillus sp.]|nr:LuxR C-terminal-related transcriptional regulator [Paenibacillus sp.]
MRQGARGAPVPRARRRAPREQDVLRLAEQGLSSAAIAKRLYLSHGTVRNDMSELIGKLGVDNRVEAASKARKQGWI